MRYYCGRRVLYIRFRTARTLHAALYLASRISHLAIVTLCYSLLLFVTVEPGEKAQAGKTGATVLSCTLSCTRTAVKTTSTRKYRDYCPIYPYN